MWVSNESVLCLVISLGVLLHEIGCWKSLLEEKVDDKLDLIYDPDVCETYINVSHYYCVNLSCIYCLYMSYWA